MPQGLPLHSDLLSQLFFTGAAVRPGLSGAAGGDVSRAFAMPVPTREHTHRPESGLQSAGVGQEALRSGWFQEREKGTSGYIHNVVH